MITTSQAKQHDPTEEKGTDFFFGKNIRPLFLKAGSAPDVSRLLWIAGGDGRETAGGWGFGLSRLNTHNFRSEHARDVPEETTGHQAHRLSVKKTAESRHPDSATLHEKFAC